METDLRKFAMYTMAPLKELLNAINGIISYEGLQASLLNFHEDYSMADAVKGVEGRADEEKIRKHVGHVFSCDYTLKDRLVDTFVKHNISMVMTSVIGEKGKGLAKETIHCWVDKRDDERALGLVRSLNREIRSREGHLKEFLAEMEERHTSLVQIPMEKSLVQVMEREGLLRGTSYGIRPLHGEMVHLLTADSDSKRVCSAAKDMMLIYGSDMGNWMSTKIHDWYEEIGKSLAAVLDTHKPCEIMDGNSPDHRIVTDSKGIHVMVKDRDLDFIEWTNPRVQEQVYGYLALFGKQEWVNPERDSVLQRREIRERSRQPEELDLAGRTELYKRRMWTQLKGAVSLAEQAKAEERKEHMDIKVQDQEKSRELTERQEDLGQGHDKRILFNAAIDHAITLGQSDLAGDLKSDKAMNGRALEGGISLGSVDTSDIYERGFSEKEQYLSDFCWDCMGAKYLSARSEADYGEFVNEVMETPAVRSLLAEDKEFRDLIRCEIEKVIGTVRDMDIPVMETDIRYLQEELNGKERISIEDREEPEY